MDQIITTLQNKLKTEVNKHIAECNFHAEKLRNSEEMIINYKNLIAELESIKNGLYKND